jgi:argininosuccinate lyase
MMKKLKFNRKRMMSEAAKGFSTATDMAEYLVMKGMPFRESHRTVGEIVLYCIEKDKDLAALELEEIRRFYKDADEDIYRCFDVQNSIDSRNIIGGTARTMVVKRIEEIEKKGL